ncbi:FAD-binding oxidoreductase [Gryllotalpicola reticulitermitis]|uniref:FAD-binding oxidoreductase n=1 Tax=Gryllotalpicola reticulitermitis TaxID=1184153 RepID=A0ABV8Q5R3_9MICO
MTAGALIRELEDVLPPGAVVTDPTSLAAYRTDRAHDPSAQAPRAVVRARSTAEVQTAVRWAAKHHVPVIPRGAGTGLSGGASGRSDALVISTELMRDVAVDERTRTVVVQPGLLNAELKAIVAEHGLWYPPDPASFAICSIGGNIATNAGGLCCVKYGVTVDYVLGLEVVLADGRVVRLGGPLIKDVAGLDLVKLFVGSEGTLGIVTEITLRLLPAPPPHRTIIAWFRSTEDAAEAIAEIACTIRPSMLEYMDRAATNAVEDMLGLGLNREAAAFVLAASDEQDPEGREIAFMLEALRRHHPISADETAAERGAELENARRSAIPAVEVNGRILLEDVGVEIPKFAQLVHGIEDIAARNQVAIPLLAHAGDGNTHPLIVFDPADAAEEARAIRAYGEVMTLAIELGGTITGEHGVGRLKRPWLERQIGADALELGQRIKSAFDPDNIFNPGTIFKEVHE